MIWYDQLYVYCKIHWHPLSNITTDNLFLTLPHRQYSLILTHWLISTNPQPSLTQVIVWDPINLRAPNEDWLTIAQYWLFLSGDPRSITSSSLALNAVQPSGRKWLKHGFNFHVEGVWSRTELDYWAEHLPTIDVLFPLAGRDIIPPNHCSFGLVWQPRTCPTCGLQLVTI